MAAGESAPDLDAHLWGALQPLEDADFNREGKSVKAHHFADDDFGRRTGRLLEAHLLALAGPTGLG
jgi:hypothetical protein